MFQHIRDENDDFPLHFKHSGSFLNLKGFENWLATPIDYNTQENLSAKIKERTTEEEKVHQTQPVIYVEDDKLYLVNPLKKAYDVKSKKEYVIDKAFFDQWIKDHTIVPVITEDTRLNMLSYAKQFSVMQVSLRFMHGYQGVALGAVSAALFGIFNYMAQVKLFKHNYGRAPTKKETRVMRHQALKLSITMALVTYGWEAAVLGMQLALQALLLTPHGQLFHLAIAMAAGLAFATTALVSDLVMKNKSQHEQLSGREVGLQFLKHFFVGAALYGFSILPGILSGRHIILGLGKVLSAIVSRTLEHVGVAHTFVGAGLLGAITPKNAPQLKGRTKTAEAAFNGLHFFEEAKETEEKSEKVSWGKRIKKAFQRQPKGLLA